MPSEAEESGNPPKETRPGRKKSAKTQNKGKRGTYRYHWLKDPARREEAQRKFFSKAGRPKKLADGWGGKAEELEAVREKARKEAKELVQKMADKNLIDQKTIEDEYANTALEYAVGVVRADVDGTRDRLAAAKLVLDFTKQKPASTNNVTVSKAEDFLAALAADKGD